MIHPSFIALELIIYDIIQLIKECWNNLNDNFDGYKSKNENMDCVSIDCTFMCIMYVIWMIYFICHLINHLLFKEKILLHDYMQSVPF